MRSILLLGLFSLVFLPEYVQGNGDPGGKSALYHEAFAGFRWIDVLLIALILPHVAAWITDKQKRLRFPAAAAACLGAFGCAIAISLWLGASNGGRNLFFDWRALALGVGLFFVYGSGLHSSGARLDAVRLFCAYALCRIAVFMLGYLSGGGAELLGRRIPLFDGPTLSAIVFASLLGFGLAGSEVAPNSWGFLCVGLVGSVFVLFCFRRTYWAELILGSIALIILSKRRAALVLLAGASLVLAFIALGPAAIDRVGSLDFTQSETEFSGDNADHLGDLHDAWEQIKETPVLGLGVGRAYPTWEIRKWKDESVMVHNAPLHVWLKYGALGLLSYGAFHIFLFRALRWCSLPSNGFRAAVSLAVLAYLSAQFVVSLGFSPWPYSAVQSTSLIAFSLALVFWEDKDASSVHICRYPYLQLR